MAEGAASEEPPQYPCPTDGSRDVEIGGDKSMCLNPTLAVETGFSPSSSSSSSLSQTATCSKTETKSTAGSVAAIDESRDVDKSKERGRKRAIELEPMDHSGLEPERKIPHVLSRVGAKPCLSPLSLDELKLLSNKECGKEIARCLEESKVHLIIETVKHLGVEKTYEIFRETAKIQSNGGLISGDGNYKKAPGGVFLSLVKKFATVEEKAAIFGTEKITKYLKRKERKKRLEREQKARQTALEKRMEKWKTEALQASTNGRDSEEIGVARLHSTTDGITGQNEEMECEVDSTGSSALVKAKPSRVGGAESTASSSAIGTSAQVELQAAEEFERTQECNLDFELHLD